MHGTSRGLLSVPQGGQGAGGPAPPPHRGALDGIGGDGWRCGGGRMQSVLYLTSVDRGAPQFTMRILLVTLALAAAATAQGR